ncbi:hypothetical protein AVEN_183639-1, partial [Araneus ventricosus]
IFIFVALTVAAFAHLHQIPVHHAPQPFQFGYTVKDKHGEQHREEVGDGKNVKGSYGFTDARGVHRQVNYVADHGGFRAQVKTNEPGTANQNPAAVHIISDAPYGHGGYAGAAGLGYAGGVGAGYGYGGVGEAGLGYGYGGVGAAGLGYGYGSVGGYGGLGYGGYGLGNGLLGGLGYARYVTSVVCSFYLGYPTFIQGISQGQRTRNNQPEPCSRPYHFHSPYGHGGYAAGLGYSEYPDLGGAGLGYGYGGLGGYGRLGYGGYGLGNGLLLV